MHVTSSFQIWLACLTAPILILLLVLQQKKGKKERKKRKEVKIKKSEKSSSLCTAKWLVLVSLYMGMRLWQLKIKQYCPCRKADFPFLLSVVLLLPFLSHREVKSQLLKEKRNRPGKNSCLEAFLHFPASFLWVSIPAQHMTFPWTSSKKSGEGAFCSLPATSTKAASLGLNSFTGVFLYCSVEKAFACSMQESVSLPQKPSGWVYAILINFVAKFHSSLDRKWRIPHSLLEVSQKLN